jgi:hypothetical protein
VLSLVPLKRLALSAQVVTSESRPQPHSVEPLSARAEEESAGVAAAKASGAPSPPAPSATAEEGQTVAGAIAPQSAPKPPTEADPSSVGMVVVLDEDSAPPPSSGGSRCRDDPGV